MRSLMRFPARAMLYALASASLLLLDAPRAQASGASNDGAVWVLEGPRNRVFIAGSVHLLEADSAPLPAPLVSAYDASREVVMEIDLDDLDEAAAARFTATNGVIGPDDAGLPQQLGARDWSRLLAACDRVALPCATMERLEPWALALLLSVTALTLQGLDPAQGVEEQIKQRALGDRKPIQGLETLEFQLGLFDGLEPRDQRELLLQAVREINAGTLDADPLTKAWREGNLRALERLLLREYRRAPRLYESLVYRRNATWVPQILALLESDRDTLVLVGTLHLVGRKGVIELLEAAGHAPRRVRAVDLASPRPERAAPAAAAQ